MRRVLLCALASCAFACSGPTQSIAKDDTPVHLGESWFEFRADTLGISVEQAKSRDLAFSEDEPPDEETLDSSVAVQAAALWSKVCAGCHGVRGDLEGAVELSEKPKRWDGFGVRMGFFFGGDSMRAGIYRKIRDGVTKDDGTPTLMRAFGDELAREQIWALVRHIEGF